MLATPEKQTTNQGFFSSMKRLNASKDLILKVRQVLEHVQKYKDFGDMLKHWYHPSHSELFHQYKKYFLDQVLAKQGMRSEVYRAQYGLVEHCRDIVQLVVNADLGEIIFRPSFTSDTTYDISVFPMPQPGNQPVQIENLFLDRIGEQGGLDSLCNDFDSLIKDLSDANDLFSIVTAEDRVHFMEKEMSRLNQSNNTRSSNHKPLGF